MYSSLSSGWWATAIDYTRITSALVGAVLLVALIIASFSRKYRALPTWPWVPASLALFIFSSVFSQIGRLGKPVTFRLPIHLLALLCASVGTYRAYIYVSAPRPRNGEDERDAEIRRRESKAG